MSLNLYDNAGYEKHREAVDVLLLTLGAREGGFAWQEAGEALYRARIGDAKSQDKLAISYSTTGAIARAAKRHLQYQVKFLAERTEPNGTIHEIWGRQVPGMRRWYVTTAKGTAELARLREAIYARDRSEAWQ